jgi:hypothetical protein
MSKYHWSIVVPLVLGLLIWYAYTQSGFFPRWVQSMVDPLILLGKGIVKFIFGLQL